MANFVSTLDGVVSYGLPDRAAASFISAGNEADRFVLGLLRACADAIIVGAGTLRQERDHIWTPDFVYPEASAEFAEMRQARGQPAHALVVFVSAGGNVDRSAPVFSSGIPVRVVTGRRSADEIVAESGGGLLVCEGGPKLLGLFVRERRLDELFLTLAPQVAGRAPGAQRLGLVEGQAFTPAEARWAALVTLKRSGDFVFSRYRFATSASRAIDSPREGA